MAPRRQALLPGHRTAPHRERNSHSPRKQDLAAQRREPNGSTGTLLWNHVLQPAGTGAAKAAARTDPDRYEPQNQQETSPPRRVDTHPRASDYRPGYMGASPKPTGSQLHVLPSEQHQTYLSAPGPGPLQHLWQDLLRSDEQESRTGIPVLCL